MAGMGSTGGQQAVEAGGYDEVRPESEGWRLLTRGECRVVELVALGRSNAQIAHDLFLSVRTVENHLYRVFVKLDVKNRVSLTLRVAMWGPRTAAY